MAIPLRYNTSGIVMIGPMFKATDGVTPATGYTTDTIEFDFFHVGATSTGDWSSWDYTTAACTLTELDKGMYSISMTSTPVDKTGHWRIMCKATSSGISFWEDYFVLPQKTYDSLVSSGLPAALDVNAAYLGSTGASMASGIMATSRNAFVAITKYIGSTLTSFTSGTMATSVNALRVMANYWGSSGSSVASGMMTSSKDAFMVAAKYWGTSTGMPISSGSMTSSKNAVIALVDYWGATGNAIATNIGTGDRTFPELLTGLSAYMWGNSTYDGSTVAYYTSDGSVELWSALLTTASRTVTTNA